MSMQTIIEAKNLFISYGQNEILKDISFKIEKGDFIGIAGPNGGGKTTLIKAFKEKGYQTVREAASILIEEEFRTNELPLWKQDLIAFQKKLITKQIELENRINPTKIVFTNL